MGVSSEEEEEDVSRSAMVKRVQVDSAAGGGVVKGRGKGPAKGGGRSKGNKTKK